MFQRSFHVNDVIYSSGDKISDMLIIAGGECRAQILVEPVLPAGHTLTASTARLNLKGKQTVDLGRIAPNSVLGTQVAQMDNMLDEVRMNVDLHTDCWLLTSFLCRCRPLRKRQ